MQSTVECEKEFKKILEGMRYSAGIRETFIDWLKIAACTLHNAPYNQIPAMPKDEAYEKIEAQYMATIKKYTREELDSFAKMLGITVLALAVEKSDFLGRVYMNLEISNDRSGEFFTPYHLSKLIAQINDPTEIIKEKGFITVDEPACGAGGMIIAASEVVEGAGFDPSSTMFFRATDISDMCCDMTYIQTSILGLNGYVRHGNTLYDEQWEGRYTPNCRVRPDLMHKFFEGHIKDEVKAPEESLQEGQMEFTFN